MRKPKRTANTFRCLPGYSAAADKENNVIGKRLMRERKRQGLVITDICARLASIGVNVSQSAVYKWESGDVIPNAYQLVAMAQVLGIDDDITSFSSAPRREQLNGEGQRRLREYRADLVASGNYVPKPPAEKIEFIDMKVSCILASAGTGQFLDDDHFETLSFPKSSVPYGADFGVRVSGDSMEPVYHDGQIVWVQQCEDLESGEEGIFIYDGCGYIKRLLLRDPGKDHIEEYLDSEGVLHKQPVLISYNKAYDPIEISPEGVFRIVGRVL